MSDQPLEDTDDDEAYKAGQHFDNASKYYAAADKAEKEGLGGFARELRQDAKEEMELVVEYIRKGH